MADNSQTTAAAAHTDGTGQMGPLHVRALFRSETINEEARTVEVTFATEEPYLRQSYRGAYYETLSFNPAHVRMGRLQSGAPLIDNHEFANSRTADSVIGVVESARIVGKEGRAVVRFSKRGNADDLFKDVVDGILRNISVGYRVYAYEITEFEDKPDQYKAVDWEPFEVSIVPVPADYKAQVRSGDSADTNNVNFLKSVVQMEEQNTPTTTPVEVPVVETRQAAPVQAPATTTQPAAATATDTRNAAQIATDERARIRRIQELARVAGTPESVVNGLVERGVSVEMAQDEITRVWAASAAPAQDGRTPSAAVTGEAESVTRAAAIENAILHRSGVAGVTLRDDARNFRNMTLLDMAREELTARGVQVRGLSAMEIARMVLTRGAYGAHSTSDFVNILGNTVNRALQAAYLEAPRTFQAFTRQTTANDFREKTTVQLSGMIGGFEEVLEGGEYKAGKFTDKAESYAVKTYGKLITITRQALINDDLGAFSRIPAAMAAEAAQLQSDLVYSILTGNPLMADGFALFSTEHANQAASGTALSTTSLSAARATFRKQTGLNGRYLNLTPTYLIVGPDLEATALAILNGQMVADSVGNVNIWKGALTLVVDPRLGSAWFLSATPSTVDTIEYAFLSGAGELYTETMDGFHVDGMQLKARMDFGTKAIDHRGLYKNAGV